MTANLMGKPGDPWKRSAQELIAKSGILERTHVIGDLNLALAKPERAFDSLLRDIAANAPLAARVMQLANSAWFGGRMKVTTVDAAFVRLGIKDFHKAAVAAALHFGLGEEAVFEPWWHHSETAAHLCGMVAQHLQSAHVEVAFQTGLLHDCAVPLLTKNLTDYGYLAEGALGCAADSVELERACNQTDHATVAAALAAAWRFPDSCVAGVAFHHEASLASARTPEARQVLAIVLLAKRVQAWADGEMKPFFSDRSERSLRGEMALALSASERQLDDAAEELHRLFRLRRTHP